MEEKLKIIIKKTFGISVNETESNSVRELYSYYKDADMSYKCFIVRHIIDALSYIQTFDINKWCMVMYKVVYLSGTDRKIFEEIIESLIPKCDAKYLTTEMFGRKLALIFLLDYLTENSKVVKIDIDVHSKLIFLVYQLLEDSTVGVIASSVLSQSINKVNDSDFVILMLPIMKSIFISNLTISSCPQFYPIMLSLKTEHKTILAAENVIIKNFDDKEDIVIFINALKNLSDSNVIFYFNCLVQSELFVTFWHSLLEVFSHDKSIYRENEILLLCLIESINVDKSCLITMEQRLVAVDLVWSSTKVWQLFLSQLSDVKSTLNSSCKNAVTLISTKTELSCTDVIEKLFEHFLTKVSCEYHLMESNIPSGFRISEALISHVKDKTKLESYIDLLMSYHDTHSLSEKEKLFIVEQVSFICQNCCDFSLEKKVIASIISFQTKDLTKNRTLPESVKKAAFLSLIGCIHRIVTHRNMSLHEYLLFLKSIVDLCIANLTNTSINSKRVKMYKSISRYIDEQLNYDNDEINNKIFPCFGAVICYLCFFLLSKMDLIEDGKIKDESTQIIEWIKDCFKVAQHSIMSDTSSDISGYGRRRMLSISSLCSEDEYGVRTDGNSSDWSFQLLDILLKMYDEDKTLMNNAVENIVSVMIRTKTLDMSAIRYLKNLIFSDSARRKKLNEFDLLMKSPELVIQSEPDTVKLEMKLRDLKKRSTNILSTVVLQSDDIDIIASCLFILLDICCTSDKNLTIAIESVVKRFQANSTGSGLKNLNCEHVPTAINSILSLSNEKISSYDGFVNLASSMIVGLMNRIEVNEASVAFMKPILFLALFENGSPLQKNILQNVFIHNTEITWMLRESLLDCVRQDGVPRISKYKAFIIIKNILKHNQRTDDFDGFVSETLTSCVRVLSSMSLEKSNTKYITIVLECLTELFKFDQKVHKLPRDLLNQLEKIISVKSQQKLFGPLLKLYDAYKEKSISLRFITMESLYENDQHLSYLLKLLPVEFTRDLEEETAKKFNKDVKEIKGLPKFGLNRSSIKDKIIDEKSKSVQNDENLDLSKKRKLISDENVNAKKSKKETEGVENSNDIVKKREKRVKKTKKSKSVKKNSATEIKTDELETQLVDTEQVKKKKSKKNRKDIVKSDVVEEVIVPTASVESNPEPIVKKKKKSKKAEAQKIKYDENTIVKTDVLEITSIEMKPVEVEKKIKKKSKKHTKAIVENSNIEDTPVEVESGKEKKSKKKNATEGDKEIKSIEETKPDIDKATAKQMRRNKIRKEKRNNEMNAMEVD